MIEQYDVIVIGGGPAGSTVGTLTGRAGHKTLVLEKARFPRYAVGESLLPFCYFPLQELGLVDRIAESSQPKRGVRFISAAGKVSRPFRFTDHLDHPESTTFQVDRANFDKLLLDTTRENATVREGHEAIALIDDAVGCRIRGPAGEYLVESKVIVDASGRSAFLASKETRRDRYEGLSKAAFWTQYSGINHSEEFCDLTTVHFLESGGWSWYIPLKNNRASVGFVDEPETLFGKERKKEDRKKVFTRHLEKVPWLQKRISGANRCEEFHATGSFSYESQIPQQTGLVLVGDALRFIDPIFSSGVFLALASGQRAAHTINNTLQKGEILSDTFSDYYTTIKDASRIMERLVRAFYKPSFHFGEFVREHPEETDSLTHAMMGNLFGYDYSSLLQKIENA